MKNSTSLPACTRFFICGLLIMVSCKKGTEDKLFEASESKLAEQKHTKRYASEGARKWHDLQLRILRLPAGQPNPYGLHGNRFFAYLGIYHKSILASS